MNLTSKPSLITTLLARNGFIFWCIVVFHLIFKLAWLNSSGLSYTETFNLFYSQEDWGLIKHTSDWNMNPPLYYYVLSVWRNLFGISEFAIRVPGVIFSSLAAGMLFLFTVKNFNRLAAIIAVLLFTASNTIYFYSQEALAGSMIFFLVLCSSYLFFDLLKEKNILKFILLGLCNFSLIYADYVTVIIPLIQFGIAIFSYDKQIFKRIGIPFLIMMVLGYLRFTTKSLLLIFQHEKSDRLSKIGFSDFMETLCNFFNGHTLCLIFVILTGIALAFMIGSKKTETVGKNEKTKLIYLLLSGIVAIFICYLLSFFIPVFLANEFIFSAPFAYILIGILVSKANAEIKYIIVGSVCFLSICSFFTIDFKTYKTIDYKNGITLIKFLQRPGTATLVQTRDLGPMFAYYFDKSIFSDFKNLEPKLKEKKVFFISNADDIKAIDFRRYRRIILAQSFERSNPTNAAIIKAISAGYKYKLSNKHYEGLTVWFFGNLKCPKKIISRRN